MADGFEKEVFQKDKPWSASANQGFSITSAVVLLAKASHVAKSRTNGEGSTQEHVAPFLPEYFLVSYADGSMHLVDWFPYPELVNNLYWTLTRCQVPWSDRK